MKRFLSLSLSLLIAAGPLRAAPMDPYEDLAGRLSTMAAKKLTEKKIAVLTFEYVDGRSSPGGRAVSEKLTNRFVELGEFTVIERGMVEKVMKELEFQNAGTVDSEAAKRLGKGLGVEAIVTGTLSDAPYGNVEINARVIKTESYEIVAAATAKVKKAWSDQPAPEAAPAEPTMSAPAPTYRRSGPRNVRGFFDLMLGVSNATMDVEFSGTQNMTAGELGLQSSVPATFRTATMNGFSTDSSTPFGLRVGAFGQIFGGAFEFGRFSHATSAQRLTTSINGVSNTYNFREGYMEVSSVHFSGDLMFRIPTSDRAYPYAGLGMGFSINNVTSPYVRMNGTLNAALNETALGFLFRIPVGMRLHLSDQAGLFLEGRFFMNSFNFTRNLSGETDSIFMSGTQFLTGFSFLF